MEIIPSGRTLGARIEGTVYNAVADDTTDEPCPMRRVQVMALFDYPRPAA